MSDQQETNEAADGQSELTDELGADFDDAEERYIHQMLAMLRDGYEKAAKPWYDRLAVIHARKPIRMVVTVAEAEAMGFKVPNLNSATPHVHESGDDVA